MGTAVALLALVALSAEGEPKVGPLSVDAVFRAVGYVFHERPKTVRDGEVQLEVWLKGPKDSAPRRQMERRGGTAFFVQDGERLFLVTAAHVAKELDAGSPLVVGIDGDLPQTIPLTAIAADGAAWAMHPAADVAALALRPRSELNDKFLRGRFVPLSILDGSDRAPDRLLPLTVVGFPRGFGAEGRFSPLSLQTLPASGMITVSRLDQPQDKSDFFMLQDPGMGGYSGAPVLDLSMYRMGGLLTTGSGARVYGLIHGTWGDDTGGKLAAVVPARFIRELIASYPQNATKEP